MKTTFHLNREWGIGGRMGSIQVGLKLFLAGREVNFHPMAFTFSVQTLLRSDLVGDLRKVESSEITRE